ncbi:hypothetical protein [Pseudomonas sp.]|uniref:hypothetical protein n=1 Tax=Pseudomonas sp. TaxID=306 RepID=UPI00248A0B70|nr:hypothetical protein [Pseudomonas sp.]MDI1330878.1 hypothetical protein [Pseudomonas sp.]
MSLQGIFKSRSQRRLFLWFAGLLVMVCFAATFAIAGLTSEPKWVWQTLNDFLGAMVASGAFAIFSVLFIEIFLDPDAAHDKIVVVPQDIEYQLLRVAAEAKDYRIYVRTGRYFRSKVLPKLIEQAKSNRRPINVEVILLDFRNECVCTQYVHFRKDSSFDSHLWSTDSVRAEILATALALAKAALDNPTLFHASLHFSTRLSIFRIEGSSDEILVTREDPKDFAYKFHHSHSDHAAYMTEFRWIKDIATPINLPKAYPEGSLLTEMFGQNVITPQMDAAALVALNGKSPYGR